jgi:hypothetical protein
VNDFHVCGPCDGRRGIDSGIGVRLPSPNICLFFALALGCKEQLTMTVDDLKAVFAVYYTEMDRCEQFGAYWALLHLALVLPDVCAALESGNEAKVGGRYVHWCTEHFANTTELTPSDRFQIRNAVLHEGSTLPIKSQYGSISFVEPGATDVEVHQHVNTNQAGKNLTLDVKRLADETRAAMDHWYASLEHDQERREQVEARLNRVARVQTKKSHIPIVTKDGSKLVTANGSPIGVFIEHDTISST